MRTSISKADAKVESPGAEDRAGTIETQAKVRMPYRPPRYRSVYLHFRAQQCWRIVFYTLPFDALLLQISLSAPQRPLTIAIIIAAVFSFLFTYRQLIFSTLHWLRNMRDGKFKVYASSGALIVVVLTVLELLFRFRSLGVYALGAVLVIAVPLVLSIRKALREAASRNAAIQLDRVLWVNQVNIQNFVVALIPILLARFVSIAGIIVSVAIGEPFYGYLSASCLAIFLLLIAYPTRDHFVVACSNCGYWTSQALRGVGYCPNCAIEKFQVIETAPAAQ